MIGLPDLSVVVPVRNAASHLGPLTEQFLSLTVLRTEILLVDDCSTDSSAAIIKKLDDENPQLTGLYHPTRQGAGVARNEGFGQAQGRYTMFFDADDEVDADAVSEAVTRLDHTGADLAMMPYLYHRSSDETDQSMNRLDQDVWQEYLAGSPFRLAHLSEVPRLLQFSNYPWNKIVRTATYRRTGLEFGRTLVHNDILGHWHVLLFARWILLLDRVVCTHVVRNEGWNLTNRQSRTRLSLFDALQETYELLAARPSLRERYAHDYWAFVIMIANWARDRLAPDLREEFDARLRDRLREIELADFARIRLRGDTWLSDRLVSRAMG